jgi:dihydrofolate synthase/folylpolyglutamate synthase
MVGVVGSKGKGTAAVYASATLAAAGLKVGTITSPGITSGRERIRIDGQAISPSDYQALGRRLEEFKTADKANAALLEGVSTSGRYLLFGLEHLLRRGCQAAVMEAGIGGASDELSVLPLRYLLMTEVFMEHVGRLGPTLADIARDKLGAASAATAKLYHLPQSEPVVAEITRAAGSGTFEAEEAASAATGHSQRNAALGVTAGLDILRHSGLRPPEARRLEATLRSVSLPGRMTALSASCQAQPLGEGAIGAVPATPAIRVNGLPEGATVLVDSAITRDGLAAALAAAEQLAGGPLDRVFVSVPADKDVAGFAAELADLARRAPGVEVTFVKLESAENLDWPKAESGPWSVRGEDAIGPRMFQGRCAAVGTALFTGAVLRALGLNAETVFTVPLGQASPQPDRPAHREPIP